MFSPIFCTSACRRASNAASPCTSTGLVLATVSATSRAKAMKSSFFATKSVSQFNSTSAASLASGDSHAPITPSAATRPAALLALAPLLMRSSSSAFFRSPCVSTSAFLHSIIPSPVSSRSSFTRLALISAIASCSQGQKKGPGAPLLLLLRALSGAALFVDFDEFVARGHGHFFHRLRATLEHRVGDAARVQTDRPARIVVAGNDVADAVGRVIRVDHADHRDAQLHRLGNGALLVADVDDEQRVRQAAEILDAAERALQLAQLALQAERLLLRHRVERAVLRHLLHFLQPLDGLLDGLEVRQHAAEPAMVDERHAAAQRLFAHDVARLALGADEKYAAAIGRQLARVLERLLVHGQGLFQVDDVDLVAVAEDERRHLRVPIPGLVSEMDPGLEHLTHG